MIFLNNIQYYLLLYTLSTYSTWVWMLARSIYLPMVLTYYQRFRNYVATPVTIPARHHLIASSTPTYCRKRKPVIAEKGNLLFWRQLHLHAPPSRPALAVT
jgi:hypothetical protein